ncbi:apolipoprotein D-like [Hyposmocoma kahamanoa]|uniref:apolipoprotein D-like n=1 Tax=Hyposmocoma kahamanoa TaxID=1477025 RepID=UPI000E6D9237|nr:apolipoprotein D-like [Hyposmocoma kahamanoa]
MHRIFLVFVLVSSAASQSIVSGKCVKPEQAQENIDVAGILGTYYQYARVINADEYGDCSTTTLGFAITTTGTVSNREVLSNGTVRTWSGSIKKIDKYTYVFDYGELKYTNYALATDKRNYILIYSCKDVPNTSTKYVWGWILSKTKQLSETVQSSIEQALIGNKDLLQANWHYTVQANC